MVQTPWHIEIANPILAVLMDRLIDFYEPDQIYIYGSRARGDFHQDSDYDLMVVVPDSTSAEARHNCYKLKEGLHIAADVKVYTRTCFDEQLHLKASMPSTVLNEGKLLYSRLGSPPPRMLYSPTARSKDWKVSEGDPPASDPVRLDNTSDWIQRARADINAASLLLEQMRLGLSLFHSQQSVEKALKAFLVWCDQPTARHHELNLLAIDCQQFDQSLEPYLQSIGWLTEWCVTGRYPLRDPPRPTRILAQAGVDSARRVYQAVLERLPQEIIDRLQQTWAYD